MCGRFMLDIEIRDIISRYNAIKSDMELYPRREIFPSEMAPVVIKANGQLIIGELKWGFMTSYSNQLLINARSETVDVKSTFKESFIQRRCIIPATGFFEWEKVGETKIRRSIKIKEQEIFSMAGLYDYFFDKAGQRYAAFTILTTEANNSMKHIHDRMPVIIPKEAEDIWLDRRNKDIKLLKDILIPWKTDVIII